MGPSIGHWAQMKSKAYNGGIYSLVISQVLLSFNLSANSLPSLYGDNDSSSFEMKDKVKDKADVERWFSQQAISVSNALESDDGAKGYVKGYVNDYLHQYSEARGNEYLNDGVGYLAPSAKLRGGITLTDEFKFKSIDADILIPFTESSTDILFGQVGLRTHDKNSFDGRTFVNTGLGYRYDVSEWMLGVNAFIDTDIKNNNVRGSLGAEAFRDYLSFSGNYYFPLTDWKESKAQELHDERPAYGFDVRTKGFLPDYPHMGLELAYEQYYGEKVDILGNGKLTNDPYAASANLIYKPVPIIEMTAGYKYANGAGSEGVIGLNFNYVFGQSLSEQFDHNKVSIPNNQQSRTDFVSRNYNIVMAYREQDSRITVSSKPINGLAGSSITLSPSVNSRYPIVSYQWLGDAELLAGINDLKVANATLTLPTLPLGSVGGKSYSLYLQVTDSRGTSVTSERIPVDVALNESTFKSFVEILNNDADIKDGIYHIPVGITNEVILSWRFVRVGEGGAYAYLKPSSSEYHLPTSLIKSEPLGGEMVDGIWIERVKLTVNNTTQSTKMIDNHIVVMAIGPAESVPSDAKIKFNTKSGSPLTNISQLNINYIAGSLDLNGSDVSPVVGSTLTAKAECGTEDCSTDYGYTWQISEDGNVWEDVGNGNPWQMPKELNGKSLQNHRVRVKANVLP